jgi:catechol 2,3-dioxygenase-like lactoylglutathione lyase family enzyme
MKWLEHVGIIVSDLDVSVDFYTRLFGAPPVELVEWKGADAEYIARMIGKPGLELAGAFFRIPGTSALLEVICYTAAVADARRPPLDPAEVGAVHLGWYVDSIDETIGRLAEIGVTDIGTAVDLMHGPYKGGKAVYFRDPDGNNLQLMEVRTRPGGVPPPREGAVI